MCRRVSGFFLTRLFASQSPLHAVSFWCQAKYLLAQVSHPPPDGNKREHTDCEKSSVRAKVEEQNDNAFPRKYCSLICAMRWHPYRAIPHPARPYQSFVAVQHGGRIRAPTPHAADHCIGMTWAHGAALLNTHTVGAARELNECDGRKRKHCALSEGKSEELEFVVLRHRAHSEQLTDSSGGEREVLWL